MSVKLLLGDLSNNEKKYIEKTLTITCDNQDVNVFEVVTDQLFLPFSFARNLNNAFNNASNSNTSDNIFSFSNSYSTTSSFRNIVPRNNLPPFPDYPSIDFRGTLRPHQREVRDKAVNILQDTGSIVISAEPGFGKTITAIELICTINTPTVIFVKQTMLVDQWINAINTHTHGKRISKISSKGNFDKTADIFIINPIILKKHISETKFTLQDFANIKLIVVDELHQIVTKVLHRAFFKFEPDYIIGLSATPYRPKDDPFEPAINWFFGNNVIGNKLFRKHIVYCIKTDFKPDIRIQPHSGKLDWSSVLTCQASDVKRNKLIIDVVRKFPERIWLILVKRVDHAKTLQDMLRNENINSETITGADKSFDKSAKILIGTTPKVGVGFDHAPVDALCMAADVLEYFEQFLGRCMRRQEVEPIVIDFEDQFGPLMKHLKSRIKKYEEHGGTVNMLNIDADDSEPNLKQIPESQPMMIKLPKRRFNKK
jgi:superfamily II DNA or RNA helicase